jgi:hypothetical protein
MKKRNYDTLGVMLDMSRNAVMSMDALKKYFVYLHKMGYNCVMLYTEDTYEVEGEPYLGYMRGRYTCDDLRELDAYAASLGIELIPCVQTLAHLQGFVPWKQVPIDNEDAMLVGDPRVYEFIENLIRSLRACFKTNRIHIGMDEAWTLGRGQYMNRNGYESPVSIMKKHLAQVCEIVRKYDFEPMIWSDMFFRSISPNNKYYQPRQEMPEEVKAAVSRTRHMSHCPKAGARAVKRYALRIRGEKNSAAACMLGKLSHALAYTFGNRFGHSAKAAVLVENTAQLKGGFPHVVKLYIIPVEAFGNLQICIVFRNVRHCISPS